MHTSAHIPPTAVAEYTGTLLHSAEARTKVLDGEGHAVPVLCMDVELDNQLHTHLHSEQPYPAGHHAQCLAAAKALKKGTRVTVHAPLIGMRLVAANTTHIQIHANPDTQPAQEQLCLA